MAYHPKVSNRRQMYQNYPAGANKMSLFIDRSITAEPNFKFLPSLQRETFIFADRRWPISFIAYSTTRPSHHRFLGKFSSTTRTRSPILWVLFEESQIWRCFRDGRYSLRHRDQNKSAKYCTCLHRLLKYKSL